MPAGRPTDYSQELTARICAKLSEGQSLRAICDADGMPDRVTVFRWLGKHEEFRHQYARAREAQMDAMAEDILSIADDGLNDTYQDENGGERVNQDVIARSRLRVDTRKWLMSKLAPKKYGDKLQHGGADDLPAIKVEKIERVIIDPKNSDSESVQPAAEPGPV